MPTIHDQRNRLLIELNMYDRRIKSNKDNKSRVEKKIWSFRKKKNESEILASFYRNKFVKAHKFNNRFGYPKLLFITIGTASLKIIQIILDIFYLGGCLTIPVAIMYVILALAIGTKLASEIIEYKNKNKYENEERSSKTFDSQIDKLEKELEKKELDIKSLEQKKYFVDDGLKEIDEYLRSLDIDFEKIREQNLNNSLSNVEQGPSVSHS